MFSFDVVDAGLPCNGLAVLAAEAQIMVNVCEPRQRLQYSIKALIYPSRDRAPGFFLFLWRGAAGNGSRLFRTCRRTAGPATERR